MGDNVMIYLDDIQHCNPEFLQKFIHFVMVSVRLKVSLKVRREPMIFEDASCGGHGGNPYTESGDKFQIPDMLANRADTYNLGDILGSTVDAFELSYVENSPALILYYSR